MHGLSHIRRSPRWGALLLGSGRYECYTTGFSLNTFFVGGDFCMQFKGVSGNCLEIVFLLSSWPGILYPASKLPVVHSRPEGFILTSAGSLQDYDCH